MNSTVYLERFLKSVGFSCLVGNVWEIENSKTRIVVDSDSFEYKINDGSYKYLGGYYEVRLTSLLRHYGFLTTNFY